MVGYLKWRRWLTPGMRIAKMRPRIQARRVDDSISGLYALLGARMSTEGTSKWAQRGHPEETEGRAREEKQKRPKETLRDREVETRSETLSRIGKALRVKVG